MEGDTKITDLQGSLILLFLLVALPYVWWLTAKSLRKRRSTNPVLSHVAGLLAGSLVFFFGAISAAIDSLWALFVVAVVGPIAFRAHRSLRFSSVVDRSSLNPEVPFASREDAAQTTQKDNVRVRSLEAMKAAEKARQSDMLARGESKHSPAMAYPIEQTRAEKRKSPKARPAPANLSVSKQNRSPKSVIDVIRFEYTNRDGNHSTREVEVTAISDDHFEGWCRTRRATRTFRLDRVEGDAVSLETGEIDNAFAWAAKNMDDARNKGVSDKHWFH